MARKKKHEEHVNHERWLVSYADFITLLFAFFVTLYAISQVDIKKLGQLKQSLQSALKTEAFEAGSPQLSLSDGQTKGSERTLLVEPISAKVTPMPALLKIESTIRAQTDRAQFVDRVRLVQERRGLIVSLTEAGFFEPGQSELRVSSETILNVIAESLLTSPYNLRIEGHTDPIPIHTAQFPSNFELSAARAASVLRYLLNHFKFNPARLSVAGYGEHRPIAPNNTADGRAMNRRVDIVVLSESEQQQEPNEPQGPQLLVGPKEPEVPQLQLVPDNPLQQ